MFSWTTVSVFCLVIFFGGQCEIEDQPRVVTPAVTYLGSVHWSARQKRKVFAFTGIPYAKPPTGERRFKPPERMFLKPGDFNATGNSPECLQWDHLLGRGIYGTEDCLYLNVYTNKIPPPPEYPNTQPTVVFLHAGNWMAGSGANEIFTPDYIIENDLTVVTINHRLGPFGFLSTESEEAQGNFGLLDQICALEWVRDNVRYFGGMNDSITVMGSGAGGISAHLLTMLPRTRGVSIFPDENALLHKAISQSGTAYSPHALVKDPLKTTIKLAHAIDCYNEKEMAITLGCMRASSASKILEGLQKLYEFDEEPMLFGPVVDSGWMGSDAVIPDEPFHLLRKRKFLQIPWIVGTNKDDGAFRVQDILKDEALVSQLNQKWDKYGPLLLHLNSYSCKDPKEMAAKIRSFYMKKAKFGPHSERQFTEMLTDRFFLYPTEKAARDHCYYLRGHKVYCYRYVLNYCGRKSFLDLLHESSPDKSPISALGIKGSNPRFRNTRDAHGVGVSFLDELLYLFPSPKLNLLYHQTTNTDGATSVATHMALFWSNFAKGGDPTPLLEGYPDDQSPWGSWWEPYLTPSYYYLQIDPDMETKDDRYRKEAMEFWESLPLFENTDQNVLRDEL